MSAPTTTALNNVEIARRWFTEGWSGNLSLADEVFSANPIIDGKPYSLDFIKGTYQSTQSAFPDLVTSVDQVQEDGDWVITRYTMHGTHQQNWRGIPASGKTITAPGISMFRFENGKVVEAWDRFDMFSLMLQIEAIPMPFKG